MSWSEIKKAVNSDLGTPLNTLITNARNHIETAGNIKCVKSVQRGTITIGNSSSATISPVNVSKSVVISNYSDNTGNQLNYTNVYLSSSTAVVTEVKSTSTYDNKVRWAVIEFY